MENMNGKLFQFDYNVFINKNIYHGREQNTCNPISTPQHWGQL
ncbi:hypothetical protein SAMN05421740_104379 [Parapedobacter koreensis]|uniref:Uncharacterized protein n=1 Tax=Parapedobacter koreensis TaxID=332977 RepID=A0A1H7PJI9_9SPHI|nr:hypothetical protein SAMN05421740_104379 [Parapedobacter koreensis]